MKEIKKDTTLSEVFQVSKSEKILAKHNVPCLTCPFAKFEMEKLKIGDICKMYNINLNKLLADLNSEDGKNK
jgi:hypothetical protein